MIETNIQDYFYLLTIHILVAGLKTELLLTNDLKRQPKN